MLGYDGLPRSPCSRESEDLTPDGTGDERDIALARTDSAREAEPLGSVPPPRR